MSEAGQIYQLIPAAMADIGAVGKDKVNSSQGGGFRYRSIDATMSALKPILTKHHIFTVPEVIEQTREVKESFKGAKLCYSILKVRYRFCAPDGSYVEVTTIGEGMDSGDKASNKAMSAAYKYALFQLFCIPTEELLADGDAENPMEQGHPSAQPMRHAAQVTRRDPPSKSANHTETASTQIVRNNIAKMAAANVNKRITDWCNAHGVDKKQFAAFRQALLAAGAVKDIPSSQMTEADCDALFAAIQSNFMEE